MSPKETVAPSALMRVLKPVAYFSLSPVSYDVLPPDPCEGCFTAMDHCSLLKFTTSSLLIVRTSRFSLPYGEYLKILGCSSI